MSNIVEGIELDDTNEEFYLASELVKYGHKLIYLTGKAGTGKTTFLKFLRSTIKKNIVVVAPTGVAAINAGGKTIHSFFKIKPSLYIPNDKRFRTKTDEGDDDKSTIYDHFKYSSEDVQIIKGLELLIIDEISMVRCDLIDVIDQLLKVRRGSKEPFGGVQVLLIGDTFQLPPIADFEQWDILKNYYNSPFFFSSKVIEQNKPIYIELKKIYRQNEKEFIELLNRVRVNNISSTEIELLNSKLNPTFHPDENSNYITLATHNRIVDNTNLTKLSELKSELKTFEATITGLFPENTYPTDKVLQLKEGAQIMFIKNDPSKRFYNGKIAKISKLNEGRITALFSDGKEIIVEKTAWKNVRFTWDEKNKKIVEETIGSFTQYPIKLAWAITVHKSQGLTFEKVIADLGAAFVPGQVYVALSRCTTFSGLVLKTPISKNAIQTDPRVLEFALNETPNTLILEELNSGKADYFYLQARESFKNSKYDVAYENLLNAFKFRNDLETPIFKKYFIVQLNRLGIYKNKFLESYAHLNDFAIQINDLQSYRRILEDKYQVKIKELEKRDNKIDELERTIDSSKVIISNLNSANIKTEENIKEKQRTIQELNIKNEGLLKLVDKYSHELERVNNLKWYQKLIGQK